VTVLAERPATHIPGPKTDRPAPVPRAALGVLPAEYRFLSWGARFAALGLAWLIVYRLLPVQGVAWFVVVAALANIALLAVGTLVIDDRMAVSDRVAQWLISSSSVVVFGTLVSVLLFVFHKGWPALHHWNFFTKTMSGVLPDAPYNQGGILQAVTGTLIEIGIAVAITLPLGIGTAIYLNEVGGRFSRIVRTVVDAMTALPSIVAGLFIYTTYIVALHQQPSGFAGALAISVMMLPIVARASDVVLRVIPGNLREASLGLGASRWRTVWHVVLPTARPGLATALILAVARGIGETSPVLIASSYATYMVTNPLHGPMSSLPLSIFTNVISAEDAAKVRGYATACVLLALVLVLFVVARLLARPPSTKPSLWRRLKRLLARPIRPARTTPSGPAQPLDLSTIAVEEAS
jgi:phosphate transport system permease protein